MEIRLPIKTVSEANQREHWAKKAKRAKMQRSVTGKAVGAVLGELPPAPIVIKLIRYGKRKLDSDNLARSFKAVRDGIADALGLDDGDEAIRWHYAQSKGDYEIGIAIV